MEDNKNELSWALNIQYDGRDIFQQLADIGRGRPRKKTRHEEWEEFSRKYICERVASIINEQRERDAELEKLVLQGHVTYDDIRRDEIANDEGIQQILKRYGIYQNSSDKENEENLPHRRFGDVEYNTALERGELNDAALNDPWILPNLLTLGKFGFNYRGLINPFNFSGNIKSLTNLFQKIKEWGPAYLKEIGSPKRAIKKLKKEKEGFVPNADGKGTDFLWGKYTPPTKTGEKGGGYGLAHIEGRRFEDKYDGTEFINNLPNLFSKGIKYNKEGHPGRFYLGTDNEEATIRTDYNGKPWQWLDSAYFKYKDK